MQNFNLTQIILTAIIFVCAPLTIYYINIDMALSIGCVSIALVCLILFYREKGANKLRQEMGVQTQSYNLKQVASIMASVFTFTFGVISIQTDLLITLACFAVGSVGAAMFYIWRESPIEQAEDQPQVIPQQPQQRQQPILPSVIAIPPTQRQPGFDGMITSVLDRWFGSAEVSGSINIDLPINKEIDYHGEKVRVQGNFNVKLKDGDVNARSNLYAQPTLAQASQPQPPKTQPEQPVGGLQEREIEN